MTHPSKLVNLKKRAPGCGKSTIRWRIETNFAVCFLSVDYTAAALWIIPSGCACDPSVLEVSFLLSAFTVFLLA